MKKLDKEVVRTVNGQPFFILEYNMLYVHGYFTSFGSRCWATLPVSVLDKKG